jgi:hypothetical protein
MRELNLHGVRSMQMETVNFKKNGFTTINFTFVHIDGSESEVKIFTAKADQDMASLLKATQGQAVKKRTVK